MQIEARTLDGLPRDQLIERARRSGVRRPELLTRVELKDEIVRLSETDERKRRIARGWLGVARDLLASVVEQGLHMPDAAKLIRGEPILGDLHKIQSPVATVTLAEIYVAQGHTQRALAILDEVLAREPDHQAARALRDRLASERESERGSENERERERGSENERERERGSENERERGSGNERERGSGRGREAPPSPGVDPQRERAAIRAGGSADQASRRAAGEAVDVVVAIVEAPGRYLYWEVSERTVRRAEHRHPDGRVVIRLLEVRASWDGAERVERELAVELPSGGQSVEADERALVRAALGWRWSDGFLPFAVGSELSLSSVPGDTAELRLSAPHRRALERYRSKA